MKRLSDIELQAAFLACSNYTPPKGTGWKQHAQTRAQGKMREEILAREFKRIGKDHEK